MALPENKQVEIPITIAIGDTVKVRQMSEKGYDFKRGAGAAFAGNLEGSVSGLNWTVIVSLAASAQGTIADHFNLVRVNTGTAGALGTDTELVVSGKVL